MCIFKKLRLFPVAKKNTVCFTVYQHHNELFNADKIVMAGNFFFTKNVLLLLKPIFTLS